VELVEGGSADVDGVVLGPVRKGCGDRMGHRVERLVLGGWDVSELAVQAPVVVPVDVLDRRDLEVVEAAPGTAVADEFGLVERVERLGHRVVVAVASRPDRGDSVGLGQALGVANRSVLHSTVAVVDQPGQVGAVGLAAPDRHLQRVQRRPDVVVDQVVETGRDEHAAILAERHRGRKSAIGGDGRTELLVCVGGPPSDVATVARGDQEWRLRIVCAVVEDAITVEFVDLNASTDVVDPDRVGRFARYRRTRR